MGVKISNLPTATEAEAASGLIPVVTDPNGDGNLVTKHITASSIGGGGASVNTSATPPSDPSNGDLWFDEGNAELYIYNTSVNGWIQTNGGGGGGSATLGDGWLDSAYWTRGVKSQGFASDANDGYNWINVSASGLVATAKPLTDHDWYDNQGRLVSNFSVPSSYYLRFKAHTLIDMDGSSNANVGTLIADGRQSLDSVVQSEDAWWSDNWWTVKNSYEKPNLASELLGDISTNVYPGQTIQPGYGGNTTRPMSCVISFSTNSLRGYGNGLGSNNEANRIYLIPA